MQSCLSQRCDEGKQRKRGCHLLKTLATCFILSSLTLLTAGPSQELLRVGIIGLDTSHAISFTKIMHGPAWKAKMLGCRVVAAFPEGSRDIESRVPRYTQTLREMGVEIVDSIDALLGKVDVVMLETNDGRPHLAQALPVLRSGKTLFIDKPVGGTLVDTIVIFEMARHYQVPIFSSSALRYGKDVQEIRAGKRGKGDRLQYLLTLSRAQPSGSVLVRHARSGEPLHGHGCRLPERHPIHVVWH